MKRLTSHRRCSCAASPPSCSPAPSPAPRSRRRGRRRASSGSARRRPLTEHDVEYMKAGGIGSIRCRWSLGGDPADREGRLQLGQASTPVVAKPPATGCRCCRSSTARRAGSPRRSDELPIDSGHGSARPGRASSRPRSTATGPAANSGPSTRPASSSTRPKRSARRCRSATWQIWNEANFFYFAYPASPQRYAKLVSISGPAIKAVDPGAKVVLTGLFGEPTANGDEGHGRRASSSKRLYAIPGIKSHFDGGRPAPLRGRRRNARRTGRRDARSDASKTTTAAAALHHRDGLGLAEQLPGGRLRAGHPGQVEQLQGSYATCSKTAAGSTSSRSTGSPGRTCRTPAASATRSGSSAKGRSSSRSPPGTPSSPSPAAAPGPSGTAGAAGGSLSRQEREPSMRRAAGGSRHALLGGVARASAASSAAPEAAPPPAASTPAAGGDAGDDRRLGGAPLGGERGSAGDGRRRARCPLRPRSRRPAPALSRRRSSPERRRRRRQPEGSVSPVRLLLVVRVVAEQGRGDAEHQREQGGVIGAARVRSESPARRRRTRSAGRSRAAAGQLDPPLGAGGGEALRPARSSIRRVDVGEQLAARPARARPACSSSARKPVWKRSIASRVVGRPTRGWRSGR